MRGHRRLVADVAAQDQVPAAVGRRRCRRREGRPRRGSPRRSARSRHVPRGRSPPPRPMPRRPARQAIAAIPPPAAKSSTRRPATHDGWSSTWRASACPPGQANAQNGGSTLRSASQSLGRLPDRRDLAGEMQSDLRDQRCAVQSGVARDEAVRLAARHRHHTHPTKIATADGQPHLAVRPEQPQAKRGIVDVERRNLSRQQHSRQRQRRIEPAAQPGEPAGQRQQQDHPAIATARNGAVRSPNSRAVDLTPTSASSSRS